MWTVMGQDWRLPASGVVDRVLARSSPGGIVCLHDGRAVEARPNITETLAAVRKIVPALKDRGYGFEVVSDLLVY
jgi:peptidoglycan/xylan/chitin deacetylase (PgdA/CDA1 family)